MVTKATLTAPFETSPDALNNRGLAYLSQGQYDRAIQDFDQVLKLDPKDADAIRNRAMAITRKNN